MTDAELIAYARGYLDGHARGEFHAMTEPPEPGVWRATVQRWRVVSERSFARLMWDRAVRRGENPTPTEENTCAPTPDGPSADPSTWPIGSAADSSSPAT